MKSTYRPFAGFVVEGKTELATYPSIVSRIIGYNCGDVPIINAGGCGTLIKYLEEHVRDMLRSDNPYNLIITVDLKDAIKKEICNNCIELKRMIERKCANVIEDISDVEKFNPLPKSFQVVIQIKQLESWWVADPEGLSNMDYLDIDDTSGWNNVDAQVENPESWIKERMSQYNSIKSPLTAKDMASNVDVSVLFENSTSFNKFYREVDELHEEWQEDLISE